MAALKAHYNVLRTECSAFSGENLNVTWQWNTFLVKYGSLSRNLFLVCSVPSIHSFKSSSSNVMSFSRSQWHLVLDKYWYPLVYTDQQGRYVERTNEQSKDEINVPIALSAFRDKANELTAATETSRVHDCLTCTTAVTLELQPSTFKIACQSSNEKPAHEVMSQKPKTGLRRKKESAANQQNPTRDS